jgi:hypothetical protein
VCFVLSTRCYFGDEIENDRMDGLQRAYGNRNEYRVLVGKPEDLPISY